MKRLIFGALFFVGCTSYGSRVQVEPTRPSMDGVIRLMGRFATAHACPFGDGRYALTAAHVVDIRPFDGTVPLWGYRWSDGAGNSGSLEPLFALSDTDLAVVQRKDGQPWANPYPLATAPPEAGERVYILGYDYRNTGVAYSPRVSRGTVIRVVADNLILNEDSKPGSSGGCVLNEASEIVGIVAWGPSMADGSVIGIAPGVWTSVASMVQVQEALSAKAEAGSETKQ